MSQMTIGKKLMLGFGVLLVVALGLAGSGLYWVGSMKGTFDEVMNKTARKVILIGDLQADLFRMRSCQRGVMLFAMHNLSEKVRSNKEEFEARASHTEEAMREIKPLLVTEEGRRIHAEMEAELPEFKGYFEKVAAASMAGKHADALQEYTEHSVKTLDLLEKASAALLETQKRLMTEATENASRDSSKARWISILLSLLALLIAPFVIIAIQGATKQLRHAATDLADGSEQIASAASQVASSSGSLAQGASEQAASLEETSASAEEITAMTRKNAENSKTAAEMMAAVDQHVQEGNRTLEEMVGSMTEINASSEKISKIIKVIDEIAFQTNILALNAAVEAARAGEAGMGFAVVADEVRNLAQRSAQAAKDTAAMIEESIAKSNEGSTKLHRVTEVIRSITDSATKVKLLVDEVNLGSQEQARGIEQISKAVAQMDGVTQTTAASAEESASASEQLSAQAEALKGIVASLQLLVGKGEQAGTFARSRPARATNPEPSHAQVGSTTPAPFKFATSFSKSPSSAIDSFPMDDNFIEH